MTVNVTLTFPESVLEWIDMERGEIKRSAYVMRLLQMTHHQNKPLVIPEKVRSPTGLSPKAEARATAYDRGKGTGAPT